MDNFNILGVYKLKHTLYPTYRVDIQDVGLSTNKEEWDRFSGYKIFRKGTIFNIVPKEVYCKIRNYDDDEIECFMEEIAVGFDYIAYMTSNHYRYLLINSLEDFEEISKFDSRKDKSE